VRACVCVCVCVFAQLLEALSNRFLLSVDDLMFNNPDVVRVFVCVCVDSLMLRNPDVMCL